MENNIYKNPYVQIIYELPQPTASILSIPSKIVLSNNIAYPKFTFGFQHFAHANKDKLSILDQFEKKKKVYHVINKFNRYIDNTDVDIDKITKMYFDIDPKPQIVHEDFFKYWELNIMFNLMPLKNDNFTSIHMMDNGGALQAIMFYRDIYANAKSDTYIFWDSLNQKRQAPLDSSFISYYKKEKYQRILYTDKYKDKASLITLSCGSNWGYRNMIEQESWSLILEQLQIGLKMLQKKGHMICMVDETYTLVMNKLIYILSELFDKVYIVRPLMCQSISSERFIVCINHSGKTSSIITDLSNELKNNKGKYVINFCDIFKLPDDFTTVMKKVNTDIANRQLIDINLTIDFIESNNYNGDMYHKYRQRQLDAADFWTKKFYGDKKQLKTLKDDIVKEVEDIVKFNINKLTK